MNVDQREFVGKICYGVVYDLWNPSEHLRFGDSFRKLAITMFVCRRKIECPFRNLPDECIFYILNMCRWDWADDKFDEVREHRKTVRSRMLAQAEADAAAYAALTQGTSGNSGEGEEGNEQDVLMDSSSNEVINNDVEMQGDEEDENEDIEDDEDWLFTAPAYFAIGVTRGRRHGGGSYFG